jgi:ribosomal protein S18 acetylase RimI-like enzyme
VVAAAYAMYRDRMELTPRPVLADPSPAIEAGHVWVTGAPITGVIELVPQGSDALLIENVAVDPRARGAGLGRLLMDFAERRASAAGLARLTLYTNEVMTESQAIYAHLGYREVGRRTDQGYRVVLMDKTLPPGR